MLTVISPAKRLDWAARDMTTTAPDFQKDAISLARTARNLTLGKLKGLMSLSDDLARLNRDRFNAFEEAPAPDSTRPAALAFAGDTYMGLEAATLDAEEMAWAQDHLRILSGLYGVMKPLDLMQAYARIRTKDEFRPYAFDRTNVFTLEQALDRMRNLIGFAGEWTDLMSWLPEGWEADPSRRRSATASTFAASLELAKEGKIDIRQLDTFAPIHIRKKADRDG